MKSQADAQRRGLTSDGEEKYPEVAKPPDIFIYICFYCRSSGENILPGFIMPSGSNAFLTP